MKQLQNFTHRNPGLRKWQTGGLTIFTGIFVLVLMTLMLLYATRIAGTEQRMSSNEVRQKLAFRAAETAVDLGLEYILANSVRIFDTDTQSGSNGAGGFRAGWFANDGATPGWRQCTAAMVARDDHPCGGEIPATSTSYFYDDPNTTAGDVSGSDSLPISTGILPANTTANVSVVLCLLDQSNPGSGCQPAPTDEEEIRGATAVIQVMGYGYSDCTDTGNLLTCTGAASISRPLSNYKNLSGSPAVPLTTKSTFPPSGTAEVVPHYNAGGVGVPVSVWSNSNPACSVAQAVVGQGSWATCEAHEWYGQDATPDGVACTNTPCSCTQEESISFTSGQVTQQGIDIIEDDSFPCDLFEFYFNLPRNKYEIIKATATIIEDCDDLGPYSSGLYWVTGSTCTIGSNSVIGSPENPIILVSAASLTRLNGGARIFGVLYVFDGEDINAELDSSGNNTVYGAVIVDANMGNYNGTFQIVYSESVLANAGGLNGVGSVSGGWRDFGLPAWQ